MRNFLRDVLRMKPHWSAFIGLLVAVNLLGPLFFLESLEAEVVIAAMLGNGMLMIALHARFGFVRLLGAGHILWVPMLAWLIQRPLSPWLWSVVLLNGFAVVVDVVDLIRYARGERARTVPAASWR